MQFYILLCRNRWLDRPPNKENFKQLEDRLVILVQTLYLFIKNSDMYSGFKYLSGAHISTHLDLDNDRGTQQTFPFTSEHLDSTSWTE